MVIREAETNHHLAATQEVIPERAAVHLAPIPALVAAAVHRQTWAEEVVRLRRWVVAAVEMTLQAALLLLRLLRKLRLVQLRRVHHLRLSRLPLHHQLGRILVKCHRQVHLASQRVLSSRISNKMQDLKVGWTFGKIYYLARVCLVSSLQFYKDYLPYHRRLR